ncbi:hypothetical protein DVH05_023144 [Phytophthora capsici]|nr:hypothetical protein DVH05_028306 [Phytophthora capsici]KAG1693744.1 hypothetical protein DVH05_023144 [Phytophthora capsici]
MLLLGVVDLVDLSALDWDATGAFPLKAVALGCCDICSIMNSHVNISSDANASIDMESVSELSFGVKLDCAAVGTGMLSEADV